MFYSSCTNCPGSPEIMLSEYFWFSNLRLDFLNRKLGGLLGYWFSCRTPVRCQRISSGRESPSQNLFPANVVPDVPVTVLALFKMQMHVISLFQIHECENITGKNMNIIVAKQRKTYKLKNQPRWAFLGGKEWRDFVYYCTVFLCFLVFTLIGV